MKTTFKNAIVLATLCVSLPSSPANAAAAITTGTVTSVVKDTGVVTILSEQTQRPVHYTGMDKAVVQFSSGKPATLADVAIGQYVTVEYAMRGKKAVIAKLFIPDPKPITTITPLPLTPGERKGLESKAARDNNPTTQPGSKANIDNDITTKPGKKDPADPDPTKRTDK